MFSVKFKVFLTIEILVAILMGGIPGFLVGWSLYTAIFLFTVAVIVGVHVRNLITETAVKIEFQESQDNFLKEERNV